MQKRERLSRGDKLTIDIDTRLADLVLGISELRYIKLDTAKSFIVSSYHRSIDDVLLGDNPEDFYVENGYSTDQRPKSEDPWWLNDPDYAPTDDEIISYFEHNWGFNLAETDLNLELICACMRAAYGYGHVDTFRRHKYSRIG